MSSRLATLNVNHLWNSFGELHPGFYPASAFFEANRVDVICVQEVKAPLGARLPDDQAYFYDGPPDEISGHGAGFLVRGEVADALRPIQGVPEHTRAFAGGSFVTVTVSRPQRCAHSTRRMCGWTCSGASSFGRRWTPH